MATPVKWLTEFQVNTGTGAISGVNDPQVIGLAGGNYLVAWVEPGNTGIGTNPDDDIVGQIFDPEGNPVGSPFQINTFGNADNENDFDIAATNDGGFSMVYTKVGPGANQEFIIYQRYDDAGSPVAGTAKTIVSNTAAGEVYSNPKIVVNNNDNSAYITYQDENAGQTEIHGVRIDANGTILTAEFDAAQNAFNNASQDGEAAINTNGELVTVYREDDAGTFGIELFIANTAGALQAITQVTSIAAEDPQVATLSNGNIAVAWVESNTVYYAVYDSNAVIVQAKTAFTSVATNTNEPSITALPQGGFVIVVDNDSANTLQARRYNNDGTTDATDTIFTVEAPAGFEVEPNVAASADGRLLFTWRDNDSGIFNNIWDTRGANIDANDYDGLPLNFVETDVITTNVIDSTVTGDSDSDTVLGQGGDDVINGGSSIDTLNGGDGDDTINGGLFRDEANGGNGNDTFIISAGNAADDVNGGANIDTLDFSASGLSGDLTFTTATSGTYLGIYNFTGIDVVKGGTAGSTYNLGFGYQNVDGGAGDDLFVHGDGQFIDTLHGGSGFDTLDLSAAVGASEAVDIDQGAGTWTGLGGTHDISGFESIIGTQEDDTIDGGNIARVIDGQGGDDFLDIGGLASFEDVTVLGGTGNDTIKANNSAFETLDGGDDIDLLDTTNYNSAYNINLATGATNFAPESFINFENIVTGNGDTTVTGTAGANVITTGTGDDSILGGGGGDTITTGAGNDFIDAQSGNNVNVDAGSGDDTVVANNGLPETLNGGADIDLLDTRTYNFDYNVNLVTGVTNFAGESFINFENIIMGDGDDTVTGTSDANDITTRSGNDLVNAGGGNDTVSTGNDSDTVNGGLGNDSILGQGGNDLLNGDGGNDTMRGGAGTDTLNGGDNNDRLFGEGASDVINGGDGDDFISGGSGNDTINGNDDNDFIQGQGNNDVIAGGTGNDTILGQAGLDQIFGGFGNDSLNGGGAADTISGSFGNDTIDGGTERDSLDGGSGSDLMFGGGGKDTMDGGANDDTMDGGTDTDIVNGGNGNDDISGGGGNDTLDGGAGGDTVDGGSGMDLILVAAGEGGDVLFGGTAADTFDFESGFVAAKIEDFSTAGDVVDLQDVATVSSFGDLAITYFGSSAIVDLGGGDEIIFNNLGAALNSGDFIF